MPANNGRQESHRTAQDSAVPANNGRGRGANHNHHMGLSDSDRPRLVVVIWVGDPILIISTPLSPEWGHYGAGVS